MQAIRVLIAGRVQGVGFRYFTMEKARLNGLNGFVRNRPDGQVEALAIGRREDLEAFLGDVNRGPSLGRVDEVSVNWTEAPSGYTSFEIT